MHRTNSNTPFKQKPEKKLLNEIAHLTHLLHGSKLKPTFIQQRKTSTTTSYGKRLVPYRAINQPFRLNGGGGVGGSGSKYKNKLVVCSSKSLRSRYRSWKHFPSNSSKLIKFSSKKKNGHFFTKTTTIKNSTGRFPSSSSYNIRKPAQQIPRTQTKDVIYSQLPAVQQPPLKETTTTTTVVKETTEKSNRYYEVQPKSSPIKTIVQRRVHPDSVSIRSRRLDTEGEGELTSSSSSLDDSKFPENNFIKIPVQSNRQLSTAADDGNNVLSSQLCDEDSQMILSSHDEESLALGDNNALGSSDTNLEYTAKVSCTSNSKHYNPPPIGLPHSTKSLCLVEDPPHQTKVQMDKGSVSLSSSGRSIVQEKHVVTNIEGVSLDMPANTTMMTSVQNSDNTTTMKPHEGGGGDSRRLRLMSKLSKLNSLKQRLDQGDSQKMPSYLPC